MKTISFEILQNPTRLVTEFSHFLQGDISGIQDFIFNTKSEGAAKTLKARSYFVQALSELCLHLIEEEIEEANCRLFYNGGGNFYVFCRSLTDLKMKHLREEMQRSLAEHEIYVNLSWCEVNINFSKTWSDIRQQMGQDKMRKFSEYPDGLRMPERYRGETVSGRNIWKEFTTNFVKKYSDCGFEISSPGGLETVQKDGMTAFTRILVLNKNAAQYQNSIVNKLPQWTPDQLKDDRLNSLVEELNARNAREGDSDIDVGDIIDFEALGKFADLRTGTDKIATLKIDVDNLGKLFANAESWVQARALSNAFDQFFDVEMLKFWKREFTWYNKDGVEQRSPYKGNLYVVFSGGDDCMVIGAWDAVFQFAHLVCDKFDVFMTEQKLGIKNPTLSAGLAMFDSKYPIVRMAALTGDAIDKAKQYVLPEERAKNDNEKDAEPKKNCITVFDRVLSWDDFKRAKNFARDFESLIKKEGKEDKQPRGLLHRFQRSHIGFERLQQKALNDHTIHIPEVWRMFYYIRKSKNLEGLEKIMHNYQDALLQAVVSKHPVDAANLFPIAARWAEFLTR